MKKVHCHEMVIIYIIVKNYHITYIIISKIIISFLFKVIVGNVITIV